MKTADGTSVVETLYLIVADRFRGWRVCDAGLVCSRGTSFSP